MSNALITLVAYSGNWIESCRGCTIGQGDSNFGMLYPSDDQSAIYDYAHLLRQKFDQSDITFLFDGRESETQYLIDREVRIRKEGEAIFHDEENIRSREKERKDAELRRIAVTARERAEREQLRELQRKYPESK